MEESRLRTYSPQTLAFLGDAVYSMHIRDYVVRTANSAKNASLEDYHKATGFEALVGWLHLKGEDERIVELVEKAIEINGKI